MKSYKTSIFKFLRWIIAMFILGIVVYFLLSGIINQIKTGESLANYATQFGRKLSESAKSITDGNGPLKVNKNGVYFKDANVPTDSAIKYVEPAKIDKNVK